jgi:hypothetical protein
MASHGGHSYTNSYISGSSRVHMGDAHHYHGPSPDERAFSSMLESLYYEGMNDRRNRLSSAERGTFAWALAEGDVAERIIWPAPEGIFYTDTKHTHADFKGWLRGQDENMFCFMGKPGSGKSTLMYVH